MTVTLHDTFIGNYKETQLFGQNPALYKQFGLAGHEGVDFGCPNGVQTLTATDGIVVKAGFYNGWNAYGRFVEIWDDIQHCATLYAHLKDTMVREGERVIWGQLIGHTDNTGNTTGPHLHFGLCLTDAAGNRLNRGNGFGGWINSEDRNLVKWAISNPSSPRTHAQPPAPVPVPPVEPPPPKVVVPTDLEVYKLAVKEWIAKVPV